jgi:hypothetical protein
MVRTLLKRHGLLAAGSSELDADGDPGEGDAPEHDSPGHGTAAASGGGHFSLSAA